MKMLLVRYSCRVTPPTGNNPFHSILKTHHSRRSSNLSLRITNMEANPPASKRPTCSKCSKPTRLCLCTRIRNPGGIANKVSVTILQHSLEQKHPLNSARIAKLGLRDVALYSVSDVNFDARFFIRLLEPRPGRVCCQRSGLSGSMKEIKDNQMKKFDRYCGFSSGRENMACEESLKVKRSDLCDSSEWRNNGNYEEILDEKVNGKSEEMLDEKVSVDDEEVLDEKLNVKKEEVLDEKVNAKKVLQVSDKVVIVASIRKYGVITDLDCRFLADDGNREWNNFDQILDSAEVVNAFKGEFAVKKLQKGQLNGSVELEDYEEFDIVVPRGTVLLFPSDNAVSVDDLKAKNIEVKNLIVLDGTWAKARRMYKENPWLRFLPHLKLNLDEWSLYREVRRQPEAGCLSTIESLVYTLKALGDDTDGLDNLLDVFESMVADQRRCKDERLSKLSAG